VKFHIYLDGGTPAPPAHIMKAELIDGEGAPLETWNTETLTRLPAASIHNDFAYNKFKTGPYGIVAEMGAMATITLPPEPNVHPPAGGNTILRLTDVNGRSFSLKDRMLGDLPPGSLGWLLIDEAGQALPQAAVGAVMRAKRAIVVGDPLQVPPVATLPERLNEAICKFFKVEEPVWSAPRPLRKRWRIELRPSRRHSGSRRGSARLAFRCLFIGDAKSRCLGFQTG